MAVMPAAPRPKSARRPAARTRTPVAPVAPHLLEPELTQLTARTYQSFHAAIARGFQEQDRDEVVEFDRRIMAHDRHFGFTVGKRWVSTFGSFERTITVPGGADVPVAAVTVVTVHPPFRRRGLLKSMMQHELETSLARGEPLAALWASEASIYGRFGFGPAASRAKLSGRTRDVTFLPGTPLSGSVDEVDRKQFLAVAAPLHAQGRPERPGGLDRDGTWWEFSLFDLEFFRQGATELRYLLHFDDAGDADGYATYRFKDDHLPAGPDGEVRIHEVWADTPAAYAGLWRYLLDLDLARKFVMRNAPVDEPLRLLAADARAVETAISDNLYIRIVDVAAALRARRYAADIDLVIGVTDQQLPANTGNYRLRGGQDGATVRRVKGDPDLTLGVLELGTVYLGGVPLGDLHRVGRVAEHTAGAVATASTAFGWHRAPWCPDNF